MARATRRQPPASSTDMASPSASLVPKKQSLIVVLKLPSSRNASVPVTSTQPHTPPSTVTLHFLPVETRQQIFELCLLDDQGVNGHLSQELLFHEHTNFKTPALVAALRCDPILYQEALYIIYKGMTLYFNINNCKEFSTLEKRQEAIKNIRHLGIDLAFTNKRWVTPALSFLAFLFRPGATPTTNHIQPPLHLAAPNLQSLTLNMKGDAYLLFKIRDLLSQLSSHAPKLRAVHLNKIMQTKHLTLQGRLGNQPCKRNWKYKGCDDEKEKNLIVEVNHFLGVEGKMKDLTFAKEGGRVDPKMNSVPFSVVKDDMPWGAQHWSWEAGDGSVLKKADYAEEVLKEHEEAGEEFDAVLKKSDELSKESALSAISDDPSNCRGTDSED